MRLHRAFQDGKVLYRVEVQLGPGSRVELRTPHGEVRCVGGGSPDGQIHLVRCEHIDERDDLTALVVVGTDQTAASFRRSPLPRPRQR